MTNISYFIGGVSWALMLFVMTQCQAQELSYSEERRVRELNMDKDRVYRQMNRRSNMNIGDGLVLERDMYGINKQIIDVYSQARSREAREARQGESLK